MAEEEGNPSDIDIEYLRRWISNRSVTLVENLDLRPATGLAAMFNQSQRFRLGDSLPLLWQWAYFTPAPLSSDIGTDGHTARGGFFPPIPLPRRMWAAGKICVHAPLHLGETVQKQSRISGITLKKGTSGPMVFVDIAHEYGVDGELRINEEQTVVYLGKRQGSTGVTDKPCRRLSDWSRRIRPDPVLLFRYSALTSNTHRIHYDREFAVHEEGYPGLLVHAPLTVTFLTELLREHRPDLRITDLDFRALRPLVDKMPFTIHAKLRDNQTAVLWALDVDQQLAVQATAKFVSV